MVLAWHCTKEGSIRIENTNPKITLSSSFWTQSETTAWFQNLLYESIFVHFSLQCVLAGRNIFVSKG